MKYYSVFRGAIWCVAVFLMQAAVPTGTAMAMGVEHVLTGTVVHVDRGAKSLIVKTGEGVKTSFRVVEQGGVDLLVPIVEGTAVVVRYTEEGAERTAEAIERLGKKSMKAVEGVVVAADHDGKTITLDTGRGAREVVHLGERALVDTGEGVVSTSEFVAKRGERLVVYCTQEGARKVAHALRRLV